VKEVGLVGGLDIIFFSFVLCFCGWGGGGGERGGLRTADCNIQR